VATVAFKTGLGDVTIQNLSGSGLGFYSTGFGGSISVGTFNGVTFVTDSNGLVQGPQCNNCTYLNTASGMLNSSTSGIHILNMPNYLATLNINFTHTSAVRLQNSKIFIYDRVSTSNLASGVTTRVVEVVHPSLIQNGYLGSGLPYWQTPNGSSYLALSASPGQSGTSINGANTTQNVHDYYVNISASPDSIGSKTMYGLLFQTEFL